MPDTYPFLNVNVCYFGWCQGTRNDLDTQPSIVVYQIEEIPLNSLYALCITHRLTERTAARQSF